MPLSPAQHLRPWVVRWMYAAALAHLLVGLLLPWIGHAPWLESYHLGIERSFWGGAAPAAAREQQIWWMGLLGATVQLMAFWMLVLVRLADRQRSAGLWLCLMAGLLLWAPQDMMQSARASVWANVGVDSLALLLMLPPLAWLSWCDSRYPALASEAPAPR